MVNCQMVNRIIVAIDGYSSCGKSTVAKALAKYAGYTYVDTGAMYRAVALYAQRNKPTPTPSLKGREHETIVSLLENVHIDFIQTPDGQHVTLNGEDVESQIRTLEVGELASQISTIKEVRAFLVAQQQAMGVEKGIVMDGRDIGTVVFPQAELKIFVTASAEVRAQRRYDELKAKGENVTFEEILKNVQERDYIDSHREVAPLRQAEDALVLDNSNMTREEQNQWLLDAYRKAVE
jgi:cytidylate kinase